MSIKTTFIREVNYVINDIKTMTRPKLANYLLGLGVAIACNSGANWGLRWSVINTALNTKATPYAGWEIVLGKIMFLIISAGCGWFAQIMVNRAQPQGHQLGVEDDAEQKRSGYGGIIGAVLFSMVFLFNFKNYLPFVIFGGAIVVFAVAIWGVPAFIKRLKKRLQVKK